MITDVAAARGLLPQQGLGVVMEHVDMSRQAAPDPQMALGHCSCGRPEPAQYNSIGSQPGSRYVELSGKPCWGYELVTYVQPGDIVLHWHKTLAAEPGIVGWSEASGAYEDTDISWQAHGTVGRARGNLKPRPAWRMPLLNYTSLANPILIGEVRASEKELRKVQADLAAQYPEGRLYFPFSFSDKRELRAQQTYFVKMPREVLDSLGLHNLGGAVGPKSTFSDGTPAQKTKAGKRGGSGYIADSAVRSAIEWHAVNLAIAAYETSGYNVEYTGSNNPYDLAVEKGTDKRRVEVKGSSGAATSVELTSGEVKNSRRSVTTDLFVATGSAGGARSTGRYRQTVETSGGGRIGQRMTPVSRRSAIATRCQPAARSTSARKTSRSGSGRWSPARRRSGCRTGPREALPVRPRACGATRSPVPGRPDQQGPAD